MQRAKRVFSSRTSQVKSTSSQQNGIINLSKNTVQDAAFVFEL